MEIKSEIRNGAIILDMEIHPSSHITSIEFFNQDSFIDAKSMFTFRPDQYDNIMEVIVHQNEINNYSDIINEGCGYHMDLDNDLVIVQIHLEYDQDYQIDKCCSDLPCCVTYGFYNKCNVYTRIMNSIDTALNECGDISDSEFVDNVLRKKMIDSCIDAKQFGKASRLWKRFYGTGAIHTSRKGCGCHG